MLTPYQIEKMKNFNGFDDVDVDQKRKTKDERRKTSIEKEQKKLKNVFKTNVSSQNHRMKKEEGATVAATPTFSQYSGPLRCFVGPF